jgi:DNA-binding transcriptional ArsR family regulator
MNQAVHRYKAEFFKALAHPARLVILEQLREGEKSVQELQQALGLDQSSVSQQLAVLRNRGIVVARREGTTAYYSVCDSLLFELLDIGRTIFSNQLISSQEMLEQLNQEAALG